MVIFHSYVSLPEGKVGMRIVVAAYYQCTQCTCFGGTTSGHLAEISPST